MEYQHDAVSLDVGAKLRELRDDHSISMRSLASKSGLSANALSMIERGKTSPSVSTLYKIADALGVPITAFFGQQTERMNAVLVRADERVRIPFARGIWEGLGGEKFAGRVEPFVLTLESGASSGPHNMVHSGHEFVLCLRGHLEYLVEKQIFNLELGDSLLFAAHLNHRWRNSGKVVTNVLILLSGFAEGEQPHVMHFQKGDTRESK